MAHTDICSNKKLEEIDNDSRKYDIAFTEELYKLFYDQYIADWLKNNKQWPTNK